MNPSQGHCSYVVQEEIVYPQEHNLPAKESEKELHRKNTSKTQAKSYTEKTHQYNVTHWHVSVIRTELMKYEFGGQSYVPMLCADPKSVQGLDGE